MKKIFINMLVLGLFLVVIFTIGTNTSWACKSAYTQITNSDDDPNDPAPAEPVPEIVPTGQHIIYIEDDPNEPEEPNEPVPE
jgi:hypothetical protein